MKWLYLLFFSLLQTPKLWAAACCGGGFALPSTIVSDDKAQFTSTLFFSEIHADVRTDGLWRARNEAETSSMIRLEGAHLLSDRWQMGFGVPVIQRKRLDQSSTGLGDVYTSIGYEYLPELEYNPWKPKGVGFLQLTLPTGRSVYEIEDIYGLDSRGRGFWALGIGTILNKTYRQWDGFLTTELHYSFQKDVSNQQIQGTLKPGWGNNSTLGLGFNTKSFRFGVAASLSYEQAIDVVGLQNTQGLAQRFATGTLMLSYLASDHWATTLSYADQTLLGSPINTSLSRILSLQVQRRWRR